MQILTIVFSFVVVISAVNIDASENDPDFKSAVLAGLINFGLEPLLSNVLSKDLSLVKSSYFEVSDKISYVMQGYFNLTDDFKLWGLNTTDLSVSHGHATDVKTNRSLTDFWLYLPISELGISLGYDMDLAILNKVPLYGTGNLKIAISEFVFNVSMKLVTPSTNYLNISVSELHFQELSLKPSHSSISGFWNNPDADTLITDIINVVEVGVILLFSYEKECVICVLDPLLEYIINVFLKKSPSLNIDCDCLKGAYDEFYQLEENLYDLAKKFSTGNIEDFLSVLFNHNMMNFYTKVFQKMYEKVEKEGLTEKYFGQMYLQ